MSLGRALTISHTDKIGTLMAEQGIDVLLLSRWRNQYSASGMNQHLPWYPVDVA